MPFLARCRHLSVRTGKTLALLLLVVCSLKYHLCWQPFYSLTFITFQLYFQNFHLSDQRYRKHSGFWNNKENDKGGGRMLIISGAGNVQEGAAEGYVQAFNHPQPGDITDGEQTAAKLRSQLVASARTLCRRRQYL